MSHDYLFHSILGMLDVETRDHRQSLDFFAGCTATPVASHRITGTGPSLAAAGPPSQTS